MPHSAKPPKSPSPEAAKPSPAPFWVLVGGCILAFLSTAMNTGMVLKFGTSVAQMSGEVSRFGRTLLVEEPDTLAFLGNLFVAITGFLLGAVISGFTIHHPTLNQTMPYGRCLIFIGACLLLAHRFLDTVPHITLLLGGFASGFQNAMATHYRGIILRTTHITGLMTDVGSHLGMLIRGHQIAAWKIFVPSIVILFYFFGSVFGAWLALIAQAPFLLWIGGIYMLGGSCWFLIQRFILHSK